MLLILEKRWYPTSKKSPHLFNKSDLHAAAAQFTRLAKASSSLCVCVFFKLHGGRGVKTLGILKRIESRHTDAEGIENRHQSRL
ncbi:Hypothetical predicted protein [Podarcis lilfordi]|nr:Hypothetical predicted protein [Podarcis lilfordi]